MTTIITGSNTTGFVGSKKGIKSFQAFSTLRNEYLDGDFYYAAEEELEHALQLAQKAFAVYQKTSFEKRQAPEAIPTPEVGPPFKNPLLSSKIYPLKSRHGGVSEQFTRFGPMTKNSTYSWLPTVPCDTSLITTDCAKTG